MAHIPWRLAAVYPVKRLSIGQPGGSAPRSKDGAATQVRAAVFGTHRHLSRGRTRALDFLCLTFFGEATEMNGG